MLFSPTEHENEARCWSRPARHELEEPTELRQKDFESFTAEINLAGDGKSASRRGRFPDCEEIRDCRRRGLQPALERPGGQRKIGRRH